MLLWRRSKARAQMQEELQEAEAARTDSRRGVAHTRARAPAVQRLVAELEDRRDSIRLPAQVVGQLRSFVDDLQVEAGRREAGRGRRRAD